MSGEADDGDKTEQPTQKRLDDARQEGQVPASRDVTSLLLLGVGVLLVSPLGATPFLALLRPLGNMLAGAHGFALDERGLTDLLIAASTEVALVLALPLVAMMVAAVLSNLGQHGPVFSPKALAPKFERISPLSGLKRLFGPKSMAEFAKNVAKIGLVGAAAWFTFRPVGADLGALVQVPTPFALERLQEWALRTTGAALVVVALIAIADVALQRMTFFQQMRMTRQQVKDETKQTDGDPHAKARIRQIRSERARHRMMAAVPEATVVITNPTHFAVALRYEQGQTTAPEVVAKGVDALAFRIRALAREHDVPIIENRPLARALYAEVEIGKPIPQVHFEAVAEVVAFVMRQRRPATAGADPH
ncbi:MAG: flagellar biosynthesis protein FlhB [Pseudomonadota bacterium]